MMHVLDYDRALGELLELDDTVRASIEREVLSIGTMPLFLTNPSSRPPEDWPT